MRATLHFSLLAATLSPTLVHSSPILFTQEYNSSPRSSTQALSESSRPGGVFSSHSPLIRAGSPGLGLGLLGLGSGNGGNGGDASSGSSYAQGGDNLRNDVDDPSNASASSSARLHWKRCQSRPGASGPAGPAPLQQEPNAGVNTNTADDSTGGNPPGGNVPSQSSNSPAQPNQPPPNTDGSPTVPQTSEPDQSTDESTPAVPVLLAPGSNNPSEGSDPPDPQRGSDNPIFPNEPFCDDLFSESLINLWSNNGGDAGDASVGGAKDPGSSTFSGSGGDASGGSVFAAPALINILSNNGGDGGIANSGAIFSKRQDATSYSGPGGDASGGSTEMICSRRLMSRTLDESKGSEDTSSGPRLFGLFARLKKKRDDPPAAYSGKGGDAPGGSIQGDHALINVGSGNGGDGGDAQSGSAYAHGPGAKAYSGAGGNAGGGDVIGRGLVNVRSGRTGDLHLSPRRRDASARPDQGKYPASGGIGARQHYGFAFTNTWPGNGGNGGDASSRDAYAYSRGPSAYSGSSGDALGRPVTGGRYNKAWKRDGNGRNDSGAAAYAGAGGNAAGGSVYGSGGLSKSGKVDR
ncbi:hypothetical protein B0F90DRAFT_1813053 [Multifurca ochricompacta]|uniref:Uncharacterized protein n=1 Tax=Multifurca ochricompacta TaxID=376703 RepID=A0AAD4QTJ5_9AGAM|nr:hypothetical protein B0F90DRAFT_1813053 [Multifurca ochricompacta]